MKAIFSPALLGVAGTVVCGVIAAGCKTEHRIIVDPITLNINLRLDQELEQAFDYQDRIESQMSSPATLPEPAQTPATSSDQSTTSPAGGVL